MVIVVEPEQFDALYELTPFVFDSQNKTETGFKYLIEVTIDGNSYNFEIPPYAKYGYGVFNVKDLIKASELDNQPLEQQLFEVGLADFSMTAGERYIDSNGNEVVNNNLVSVSNRRITNAVREHDTNWSYQLTDFLTDNPGPIKYVPGQPALLPFRKDSNKDSIQVTGVKSKSISSLNKDSLQILDGNEFTSVRNYTIQFIDDSGFPSVSKDFEALDCYHDRVTPYTLVWLNSYGAWDSFPFTLRDTTRREITSETYKSKSYRISDSVPIYEETYRGYRKFGVRSERTKTLRSDWISEEELAWLANLFDSPEVFIHDGNGYKGVIVESDEVEEKIGQKLFNLNVNVRYAVNSITQAI